MCVCVCVHSHTQLMTFVDGSHPGPSGVCVFVCVSVRAVLSDEWTLHEGHALPLIIFNLRRHKQEVQNNLLLTHTCKKQLLQTADMLLCEQMFMDRCESIIHPDK